MQKFSSIWGVLPRKWDVFVQILEILPRRAHLSPSSISDNPHFWSRTYFVKLSPCLELTSSRQSVNIGLS